MTIIKTQRKMLVALSLVILLSGCLPVTEAQILSPYQSALQAFYDDLGSNSQTFENALGKVDSGLEESSASLELRSLRTQILLARYRGNPNDDEGLKELISEMVFLEQLKNSTTDGSTGDGGESSSNEQADRTQQPWVTPRLYSTFGHLLMIKASNIQRDAGSDDQIGRGIWRFVFYKAAEAFFYKAYMEADENQDKASLRESQYASQGYVKAQQGIYDSLQTSRGGSEAQSKKALEEVVRILVNNESIVELTDSNGESRELDTAEIPKPAHLTSFNSGDHKELATAYEILSYSLEGEIDMLCNNLLENPTAFAENVSLQISSELSRAMNLAIALVLESSVPGQESEQAALTNSFQRLTLFYTSPCR